MSGRLGAYQRRESRQPPANLRGWATISTGPFRFGAERERKAASDDAPALAELRAAETFRAFVDRVTNGRFQWYDHCVRAAAVLQRVADGELDRVLILWPPRHGKSELVSRLFTAYYLARRPDRWVGLSSYAAALAHKLSRSARDHARAGGVQLRDDADAVTEWQTTAGGGLWAAGVGGPATGRGMHLGIVDDPIKNAQEAASATIAERNQEWWASTWYTRQEPGAALIVVTTRWPGPADLVTHLFDQEAGESDEADGGESLTAERWHVVAFEAEKQADRYEIPATCTLEPDPRAPGEPLCPERYPLAKLRKVAKKIGTYFYRSLFLQRKSVREGKMFRWEWWVELAAAPAVTRSVRYVDLAGTEPKKKGHDPDYTASTLMGRMSDQRAVIFDVTDFRESVGQRDVKLEAIACEDLQRVPQPVWWFERETGVGGQDRTDALVRRIQALGLVVNVEPATGSKLIRAEPLASAAEAKNVCVAPDTSKRPWRDRFRAHMADFSAHCDHDDIADATSGAYNKLTASQAAITSYTVDPF